MCKQPIYTLHTLVAYTKAYICKWVYSVSMVRQNFHKMVDVDEHKECEFGEDCLNSATFTHGPTGKKACLGHAFDEDYE